MCGEAELVVVHGLSNNHGDDDVNNSSENNISNVSTHCFFTEHSALRLWHRSTTEDTWFVDVTKALFFNAHSEQSIFYSMAVPDNQWKGNVMRGKISSCFTYRCTQWHVTCQIDMWQTLMFAIVIILFWGHLFMHGNSDNVYAVQSDAHLQDSSGQAGQRQKLDSIQASLRNHGVQLTVRFSATLHDREIRWVRLQLTVTALWKVRIQSGHASLL